MPSFFTDTDCLTAQKQLHIVLNVVNLNPQPEKGSLCMISFKTSGAIISSTPKIKKKKPWEKSISEKLYRDTDLFLTACTFYATEFLQQNFCLALATLSFPQLHFLEMHPSLFNAD